MNLTSPEVDDSLLRQWSKLSTTKVTASELFTCIAKRMAYFVSTMAMTSHSVIFKYLGGHVRAQRLRYVWRAWPRILHVAKHGEVADGE